MAELPPLFLAAFVSPGYLYAGIAATGIPILIHLLARRRFTRVRWAAMEFLIVARQRNRRRIQMEEWILLALRCLAVLAIGSALARPFLSPTGLLSAVGSPVRTEHVLVIDDSFSMGYKSDGSTSFNRAQEAARRLLVAIRTQSPGDTVTLLRMSAADQPIDAGAFLDDARVEAVLAHIDELPITHGTITPAAVLQGVAQTLATAPEVLNAAVYLFSDFQQRDWAGPNVVESTRGAESGIFAPLSRWAGRDRQVRVVLANTGDPDATNTAVTRLQLRGGRLVAGTEAVLQADLVNWGARPATNVEGRVELGGSDGGVRNVDRIEARQKTSVEFSIKPDNVGVGALRVELAPDGLPIDDVRYLAVDVAAACRALVVNGEPSPDPFDDEVLFLTTALRPRGEIFSGIEPVVIDEAELADADLGEYHAVILANVYRLSESAVDALECFADKGGGVVFFVGDQVDPGLYNASLYRNGAGLLPVALDGVVRVTESAHLVATESRHPITRNLLVEGDPLGIDRVAFTTLMGCTLPQSVAAPDEADTGNGSVRVATAFDDETGRPAIVERAFGNGRVVLVLTSADKEWNNWPDHPTYLPFIMELLRYAASGNDQAPDQLVGAPIRLPIDPVLFDPEVLIRTPLFPAEPETRLTAKVAEDGHGLSLVWEDTNTPGVYQFELRRRGGPEEIRMVAVNVDSRESDLAMASEAKLRRAAGDFPIEYVEDAAAAAMTDSMHRHEQWMMFLVAAIVILMTEHGLAWCWGGRS